MWSINLNYMNLSIPWFKLIELFFNSKDLKNFNHILYFTAIAMSLISLVKEINSIIILIMYLT